MNGFMLFNSCGSVKMFANVTGVFGRFILDVEQAFDLSVRKNFVDGGFVLCSCYQARFALFAFIDGINLVLRPIKTGLQ